MAQGVQAVETVVALPDYREQMLTDAPAIARYGGSGPRRTTKSPYISSNNRRKGLYLPIRPNGIAQTDHDDGLNFLASGH